MSDEAKSRIACVSVGITGIVDTAAGISLHAYGVWERKVEISAVMSEELGLPVLVENNVDALAQAEILFGLGRKTENLLLIKWGPGVGSAIILDGAIYKGRRGKAAELGHYIVNKDGSLCSCGRRGCLETEVSYYTLSKRLEFETDAFGQAYEAADEDTRAYIDSAIDLFARCVVNSSTIIAPNHIVLEGRLFDSGIIRSRLISACRSYDKSCGEEYILHSPLASRDGFVGPAAVYVQKLFG
jgi:predicted NBD/HSP70 family sugar kinase